MNIFDLAKTKNLPPLYKLQLYLKATLAGHELFQNSIQFSCQLLKKDEFDSMISGCHWDQQAEVILDPKSAMQHEISCERSIVAMILICTIF